MKGCGEASGSDDDLCDCGVCLEDVRTLDGELFRVNINLCKVMVRASVIYIKSSDTPVWNLSSKFTMLPKNDASLMAGAIWQCPEGHVLCCKCYDQLGGPLSPCPSCSTPLSSIRSRSETNARESERVGTFIFACKGQHVHLTPTHTMLQRTRPAQTYATRVLERQRDKTARKLCMAAAECDAAAASGREKVAVSTYTKMHIYVPQVKDTHATHTQHIHSTHTHTHTYTCTHT